MAAETVPRLPAIKSVPRAHVDSGPEVSVGVPDKNDADDSRHQKASSYLARLQLGSVRKQPRPGDVYRPRTSAGFGHGPSAKQRPLGLIPDRRDRMNLLAQVSRLLAPVPGLPAPYSAPQLPAIPQHFHHISQGEQESEMLTRETGTSGNDYDTRTMDQHSPRIARTTPVGDTIAVSLNERDEKIRERDDSQKHMHDAADVPSYPLGAQSTPHYRLYQYGTKGVGTEHDPDYAEMFTKSSIREYFEQRIMSQVTATSGIAYPRKRSQTLPGLANTLWSNSPRMTTLLQLSQSKKGAYLSERTRLKSSSLQYMKFSGQAKLWNKSLTDDRRDALDYEPCERCRLRGGRCARCKAIRTGGGYIILDDNGLSDDFDSQGRYRNGFGLDDGYCYGHGDGRDVKSNRYGGYDGTGFGKNGQGLDMMDGDGHLRGSAGDGLGGRSRGAGGYGDRLRSGGGGEGDDDGFGDGGLGRNKYGRDGLGDGLDGEDGNRHGRDTSGDGLGVGGSGDDMNGGEDELGRLDSSMSASKLGGSRPPSTLGSRPGSSRKFGSRGSSRRGTRRNIGADKKGRMRGSGEDGEDGDSDGEGGRRSRRRRGHGDGSDDDGNDRDRMKFTSGRQGGEDEEEGGGSYANLMRFKKKRDDVKALHATMKELQGIDPLDYLARYCIIDQSKLPHYQHAYDNVDRDEDDEIDIAELDFALKTVNYNLITDAEMNYVHSVLELAGRYKLNFRLFSLIAALSEKVVSLEDMVKRLINKMDFEALEVKMKKCKELFYLLADNESSEHEGGVVTTGSLAVELQAGGLTSEHVEYVVDRLNHEDKGIVEFLDYLTYVPLFVEIHDTISGNPLDFSRTK